ncbi:nucleotidyltransferase family protein [Psychrobacillus sp. NPDC096426]|uniref:nucleotidyltransferase domain-containing protein n=1 Tax=Psychrobacillus sp. NPDC096426 TaxID=3364491 RepID=UPI0037F9B583
MKNKLNLSKIPKEVLFILELLEDDNKGLFQKKNHLLYSDLDWQLFVDYATHHRLYPVLYNKVKQLDEPLLPDSVLQSLKELYKENTYKMLQLSGEMSFINNLLYENRIKTIFLKGPILAKDLYGDISLRTSGDLDFLIPIERIDEAEKLLVEQGYKRKDNFDRILNDWKFRNHHVTYFHPHKRITLEIHWRLHPGPARETNFQDLWERKRESNLTASPISYLGKEDLFHFLVVHGARHGWYRLRWLHDIHQIMKQSLNWDLVYALFKKNHHVPHAGQALILASQLFGTKLTNDVHVLINNKQAFPLAQKAIFYLGRMENLHSPTVSKDITQYHKHYILSSNSIQTRCLMIITKFYPSSVDAVTLPLPKYMHFLYFPLRPILSIYRKIKKPILLKEDIR